MPEKKCGNSAIGKRAARQISPADLLAEQSAWLACIGRGKTSQQVFPMPDSGKSPHLGANSGRIFVYPVLRTCKKHRFSSGRITGRIKNQSFDSGFVADQDFLSEPEQNGARHRSGLNSGWTVCRPARSSTWRETSILNRDCRDLAKFFNSKRRE